ncbi:1,4-alpha-glucan branching enzyme GlgB [uncultured archaeon]|nr:1,4-alpha-glucan branching enzyme GlgB [uncultured archaeon]
MQRLIDKAHCKEIAVIIDVVYGHTDSLFPYCYLYRELGYNENPFMGPFAKDYFGESTDFNRELTRDFFFTVNHHWLDTYHVDGFRYDCVPNYWDGPTGQGFSNLVYETYSLVKAKKGEKGYWQRFFEGGNINLIQCAEQLEGPEEVLEKTYCSSTWQNQTFNAATEVANQKWEYLTNFGHRLGLLGYPHEVKVNDDNIRKTALQYIENHDHFRFVCNFRTISRDSSDLLIEGDRSLWYKVQPYMIAITMAKGIPMLWQGQALCENYFVPNSGLGSVAMFRPMRWDYFYDFAGKKMISLVRKLLKIRMKPQFLYGDHWFYDDPKSFQSRGLMLFSRRYKGIFSLVALNFGDSDQEVFFQFPLAGEYEEELHGQDNFTVDAGEYKSITIPSNYGRIWSLNA